MPNLEKILITVNCSIRMNPKDVEFQHFCAFHTTNPEDVEFQHFNDKLKTINGKKWMKLTEKQKSNYVLKSVLSCLEISNDVDFQGVNIEVED